ncbi:anti-adapter protein IraP [Pantoea allii]|uniref:Anti-adapter protein IraP n=1 Tax=Pantoea allii TaxID=574096 RepID=A0ABS6VFX4_9GAMM|nr:anti-adapter protein IraP [Pantoea allii]MBW1213943.1 anti-adapter protein IraP [Pantoea allii]MBW1258218.1 anti-adapter protein IraP [Pantoea allii]MBW1267230.1 anti-adapter protein IraP [Pantoea allii]MBW1289173.1 anti-adapter protein IraP [Pantoea allii]
MKNLIAELLITLAEKEEASKEQVAQIEALEVVITAMLRMMPPEQHQSIVNSIESAMVHAGVDNHEQNGALLKHYVSRLLKRPSA